MEKTPEGKTWKHSNGKLDALDHEKNYWREKLDALDHEKNSWREKLDALDHENAQKGFLMG